MKKMVFFNTLVPLIKKQNEQILKDREFIEQFFKTGVLNTKRDGIAMLKMIKLKKYYKVKKLYDYDSYMKKINIIPTSIILAQAALESGWGNSRFTKEANNIFGHWTYGSKGLIPLRRNKGAKHKIRIFDSLEDSLKAYLKNVNSNGAYKQVRNLREKTIKNNKPLNGLSIYKGFINYSQLKHEYLRRLKNMIIKNKLLQYDN